MFYNYGRKTSEFRNFPCARGQMDTAPLSGGGDSGFESRRALTRVIRGRVFFIFYDTHMTKKKPVAFSRFPTTEIPIFFDEHQDTYSSRAPVVLIRSVLDF